MMKSCDYLLPGLKRRFFREGLDSRGAFRACVARRNLIACTPPVLLRAVCLVRAMILVTTNVKMHYYVSFGVPDLVVFREVCKKL